MYWLCFYKYSALNGTNKRCYCVFIVFVSRFVDEFWSNRPCPALVGTDSNNPQCSFLLTSATRVCWRALCRFALGAQEAPLPTPNSLFNVWGALIHETLARRLSCDSKLCRSIHWWHCEIDERWWSHEIDGHVLHMTIHVFFFPARTNHRRTGWRRENRSMSEGPTQVCFSRQSEGRSAVPR